ncbi:Vta1 like-domain-containing protein [Coprinopsis sp. MPI-PUGE-AT-0042]|nr:Vta1 like-domain-containing protein [Coprinopsis sp. MPI-PUGE-AT-0042]
MSSKSFLNLPPITPELKVIGPYLQRAEEVKNQEPIIAYWCAYYAAQMGIGLKAKDSPSREILLALLGALERLKNEIGPNDAVDVDAAGAAYVENFALKVFASADNEDRAGRANKATAKKFLAAAHFLEVLKTFSQAEVSESVVEKVKYAKWKAADIAKAIREGRKPTPGPAGSTESEDEVAAELGAIVAAQTQASVSSSSPSSNTPPLPSVPPSMYSQSHGAEDWSIVATPGTELGASLDPAEDPTHGHHVRKSSGGSSKSASGRRSPRRKDGAHSRTPSPRATTPTKAPSTSRNPSSKPPSPTPSSRNSSPGGSEKRVHFTPSVVGGSVASGSPTSTIAGIPSPPTRNPTSHIPSQPPPANSSRYQTHQPPPPPVSAGPVTVELTPALIAKAQKHCKFAISSLDYEDAAQAKKELRAALALLGG